MNRFRVAPGRGAEFEDVWRRRDSRLREVPGFVSFRLLRGPETDEDILYVSHTTWTSRAAFEAWTRSELTDYLERQVNPLFAAINGVQRVGLEGGRSPAMRVWIDPDRLAALNLGADDVMNAIRANNVIATNDDDIVVGTTATAVSPVVTGRRVSIGHLGGAR